MPSAAGAPVESLRPHVDPDVVLPLVVELFANEPSLAKQLRELARSDAFSHQVASLFHYLFVVTSHPADGANYNVLRYRLRDVDERNAMFRTENADLADFDGHRDLVVTPEMIRAGIDEVFQITESDVMRVYRAMEAERRRSVDKELRAV